MRLHFLSTVIVVIFCLRPAYAMLAPDMSEPVPVARLVNNISKYIKSHPKDANGYYTLARVHSIAFAQSFIQPAPTVTILRGPSTAKEEQVVGIPRRAIKTENNEESEKNPGKKLPDVGGYGLVYRNNSGQLPSSEELYHLRESVRYYTKATALAKQDGYCWLGYAWMLEQGVPYAVRLGSPWANTVAKRQTGTSADWAKKALAAYRRAYQLESSGYKFEFYNTLLVEAGEGILRLQAVSPEITPREKAEEQRIKGTLAKMKKAPALVSPIILPLGKSRSLTDLLSQEHTVQFDLTGDGLGKHWPWVSSETGILVWDPKREGHITSGRQLFGSVTWWVFWKNGYQALSSLDNDANGILSGPELDGISIWRDANGNGVSDTGEVKPITDWGIVALSTQVTQQVGGIPANLQGATTASGSILPTYDWTPQSIN